MAFANYSQCDEGEFTCVRTIFDDLVENANLEVRKAASLVMHGGGGIR